MMAAAILSSKLVRVKKGASFKIDAGEVSAWLAELNVDDDVEVIISVRTLGDRQRKMPATQMLRHLTDKNTPVWEKYDYRFNFSERQLFWKDRLLHFSAGEMLFLYRWLVLNQHNFSQMYFIHNARKRYGREFLQEVIHA
jgi:hypothetical protein